MMALAFRMILVLMRLSAHVPDDISSIKAYNFTMKNYMTKTTSIPMFNLEDMAADHPLWYSRILQTVYLMRELIKR